jgi:5-formyltetrahydrofolate cyclo-ligase
MFPQPSGEMLGAARVSAARAAKASLRRRVGERLAELTPTAIEEGSTSITQRLVSTTWFSRARTVSVYLSMPAGEVQTSVGNSVHFVQHC